MTRSPRTWLLVAVILAAGLAGCTASEESGDPEPISAKQALEQARPTAEAWDERAQLVVTSGFEGAEGSPAVQQARKAQEERSYPVYADPLPGDGRAPQWVMVFLAGERTRSMRVTAEETVWMDEGAQPAGPGARTVGEWTVDSTDAVEQARQADEGLDQVLAASDVSVFLTLAGTSRGTQWQVQANSHSVGEQSSSFVDARTGEVRNRSQMQTDARTQSFEGTLERGETNATHEVALARNGTRLAVELTWNNSGEDARLSAGLLANGTEPEPAASSGRPDRFQARWDGLDRGDYRVEVGVEAWGEAEEIGYELRVHVG